MLAQYLALLNKNKILCLFKEHGDVFKRSCIVISELEASSISLSVALWELYPF